MATEEEIKTLAYNLWEEESRPEGKDVEHYYRAKMLLEEQEAARVIELGPPPVPQLAPKTPAAQLSPPPQKPRPRRKKK